MNATDPPTESFLYVTTKHGIPNRRRGNIAFDRVPREVRIVDATDDEIAARVAAGEFVVNASGAKLLADDDGLNVNDRPPVSKMIVPEPPTSEPSSSPTPRMWREVAADRGLVLPAFVAAALVIMRSAFAQWLKDDTDERVVAIVRRLRDLVLGGTMNDEVRRLRHALADLAPLCAPGGGVFGSPSFEPLAPTAHRWASNEGIPQWMKTLALQIGATFPHAFDHPFAAELDAAMSREAALDTLVHHGDAEELAAMQAQAERDVADVHARTQAAFDAWHESVESVRRRVMASIDMALARKDLPALVRFALGELARYGRDLPTWNGFDPDDAVGLVLGAIALDAPSSVLAERGPLVRLRVATKGITRRRRAGLEFGVKPTIVEVDDAQRKLIEADDGLTTFELTDAGTPDTAAELRDQLAARETERAQLTRQLEALPPVAGKSKAKRDDAGGAP